MIARLAALVAGLALMAALALGGTAPLGRVLLAAGLPTLARPLFRDPDWRGVAAYRAGDHAGAAVEFGRGSGGLNLGNAHAMRGEWAAALEAYDIARAGGDMQASANFDLVAAFYAGLALDPTAPIAWSSDKDGGDTVEAPEARGNARAASTGDGVTNTGTLLGLPELQSHDRIGVRKVFDDRFMVADPRWLATLSDVPGDYLAARIAHEYKRRDTLGLRPPDPEDPS